ncbi:hypothetical protein OXIME_000476 [Oxyplasma meridianum]|uniref:Segregation/condensation protein A n=1 Tax=Oxyplasma meridianum TaxID=3073602 RepID=A0AAX4NGQ5_9ARCH
MDNSDILNSIITQGTLLDSDVEIYKDILENLDHGAEYSNPFYRSVARIFEMCKEGLVDPWSVNIIAFSAIFESLIDDKFRDFGTAGYVLTLAWHVLMEKSDISVKKRMVGENDLLEPEDQEASVPTEIETADATVFKSFREAILPLDLPVRSDHKSRVLLVELLEYVKTAYRKKESAAKREKPEEASVSVMEDIVNELHAEEPEKEINELYEKIKTIPETDFYIDAYFSGSKLENFVSLVYCLFLCREKKIWLSQEGPYMPIVVHKIEGGTDGTQ